MRSYLLAVVLLMLLEPAMDLHHQLTKRFSRGVGSEFSVSAASVTVD